MEFHHLFKVQRILDSIGVSSFSVGEERFLRGSASMHYYRFRVKRYGVSFWSLEAASFVDGTCEGLLHANIRAVSMEGS